MISLTKGQTVEKPLSTFSSVGGYQNYKFHASGILWLLKKLRRIFKSQKVVSDAKTAVFRILLLTVAKPCQNATLIPFLITKKITFIYVKNILKTAIKLPWAPEGPTQRVPFFSPGLFSPSLNGNWSALADSLRRDTDQRTFICKRDFVKYMNNTLDYAYRISSDQPIMKHRTEGKPAQNQTKVSGLSSLGLQTIFSRSFKTEQNLPVGFAWSPSKIIHWQSSPNIQGVSFPETMAWDWFSVVVCLPVNVTST